MIEWQEIHTVNWFGDNPFAFAQRNDVHQRLIGHSYDGINTTHR
jgi:hypothetical protein